MYTTFSNTFETTKEGLKKFYFTVNKQHQGAIPVYEGKINDDTSVPKFKMRKDDAGQWKMEGDKIPAWVWELETAFGTRIEASIGQK